MFYDNDTVIIYDLYYYIILVLVHVISTLD